MRGAPAAILTVLLLAFPLASASEAEGNFLVQGRVRVPPGTSLEGPAFLALAETNRGTTLEARIPEATLFAFTRVLQQVPVVGEVRTDFQERSWPIRDATLRLLPGGEQEGFIGFYPSDSARLRIESAGEMETESRTSTTLGTVEFATDDPPGRPQYYQEESRPHIYASAQGGLSFDGEGAWKLVGADFEIVTPHNTTRHETGRMATGAMEAREEWVYLRLDAPAHLTLVHVPALEVVVVEAGLHGKGALRFTPVAGEMRTEGGTFAATSTPATLEGAFSARLVPVSAGSAQLEVRGALAPSSAFAPRVTSGPLSGAGGAWLLILGAVAGLSVGGGVGLWAALRYRSRAAQLHTQHVPFTLEECLAALDDAASNDEHEQALGWVLLAQRAAPLSARLVMEEATCRHFLGEKARAFELFEKAHSLSTDGETALLAAQLLYEEEGFSGEVARWARRALDRNVALVEEIQADFPEVTKLAEWGPVLDEAWRRFEAEWE